MMGKTMQKTNNKKKKESKTKKPSGEKQEPLKHQKIAYWYEFAQKDWEEWEKEKKAYHEGKDNGLDDDIIKSVEKKFPKFIHREDYLKSMETLREYFYFPKGRNDEMYEFFSTVLLVEDSVILLEGDPGTGKSALIKMSGDLLAEGSFARIALHPQSTPDNTLFKTRIYETTGEDGLKEIKIEVIPTDFLKARFKFADEFNRGTMVIHDGMMTLASDHYITAHGKELTSPKGLTFYAQNQYVDNDIGKATLDRIDYSIIVPPLSMTPEVHLEEWELLKREFDNPEKNEIKDNLGAYLKKNKPKITIKEIDEIWEDVKKVKVPQPAQLWALIFKISYCGCKKTNRGQLSNVQTRNFANTFCKDCSFKKDKKHFCWMVKNVLAHRILKSILKLAQARAWIQKRKEVSQADVEWATPFTLAHRLTLQDQIQVDSEYPNNASWVRWSFKQVREERAPFWKKCMNLYVYIVSGNKKSLNLSAFEPEEQTLILKSKADALKQLRTFADHDLVMDFFYHAAENLLKQQTEAHAQKINNSIEELEKDTTYTNELIHELAIKINDETFGEQKLAFQHRLEALSSKLSVNIKYYDKTFFDGQLVPKLGQYDSNLAQYISQLKEKPMKTKIYDVIHSIDSDSKGRIKVDFNNTDEMKKFKNIMGDWVK